MRVRLAERIIRAWRHGVKRRMATFSARSPDFFRFGIIRNRPVRAALARLGWLAFSRLKAGLRTQPAIPPRRGTIHQIVPFLRQAVEGYYSESADSDGQARPIIVRWLKPVPTTAGGRRKKRRGKRMSRENPIKTSRDWTDSSAGHLEIGWVVYGVGEGCHPLELQGEMPHPEVTFLR